MLLCKCTVSCMKHICELDLNIHHLIEHAGCMPSRPSGSDILYSVKQPPSNNANPSLPEPIPVPRHPHV